jgi:hypothetical protein
MRECRPDIDITIVSSFSSSRCDVNRWLQIDVETYAKHGKVLALASLSPKRQVVGETDDSAPLNPRCK